MIGSVLARMAGAARYFTLAVTILIVSRSMADDSAEKQLPKTIADYFDHYVPGVTDEKPLFDACESYPEAAESLMEAYLKDPRVEVRRMALDVICEIAPERKARIIVDALDEPIVTAFLHLRGIRWDKESAELRELAKSKIRQRVELGGSAGAEVLAMIGGPEELPAFRIGLARIALGQVELGQAGRDLQHEWEQTKKGIPPIEEEELYFRQIMAKLGDAEQLDFFLNRMGGADHERAVDALRRSKFIARPELAQAVAAWLADPTEPVKGYWTCGAEVIPWGYACAALSNTYPTLVKGVPVGDWRKFWIDWAAHQNWKTAGHLTSGSWIPLDNSTNDKRSDPAVGNSGSHGPFQPTNRHSGAGIPAADSPTPVFYLLLTASLCTSLLVLVLAGARAFRRRR